MSWHKGLLKNAALPLVAGGLGAWLVASLTRAPAPASSAEPRSSPGAASNGGDLDRMKSRLDRLERAQSLVAPAPAPGEAPSPEASGEPQPTPEPPPIEERKKQRRELAASLREDFEQDARDGSWAPKAERSFDADLRKLDGALGTTTRSVRCKTTHCYAEIEAPDLSSGKRAAAEMMRGEFSMRCLRTAVVIDEQAQPIKLAVGLDCTDLRAEGQ
jgi:hypothetical protein